MFNCFYFCPTLKLIIISDICGFLNKHLNTAGLKVRCCFFNLISLNCNKGEKEDCKRIGVNLYKYTK